MGIEGFKTGDDDEDEDVETKVPEGQRGRYVEITESEVHEFFEDLEYSFVICNEDPSNELVFESNRPMPDNKDITLRVFSSVDERSGKGRDKGSDAIRTVLWHRQLNRPIGGRTRTHRIATWRKNLKKKIESLVEETDEYIKECPKCQGYLVEREGSYGKFLGCTNWKPEGRGCDYTQPVDEEVPDEFTEEEEDEDDDEFLGFAFE